MSATVPFRLCLAAAFAALLAFAGLPEPAAAQNFPAGTWRQSCKDARMEAGNVLRAECRTRDGRYRDTRLDVDRCGRGGAVGNNNGELYCERTAGGGNFPGGSWRQSCKDARMEAGNVLRAECRTRDGRYRDTRIDVDRCGRAGVANDNGQLVCEGHAGGGPNYRLPPGPWAQVCRNARIDNNGIMRADCPAGGNSYRTYDVNLNRCPGQPITFADGDLRCPSGQSGGGYQPWWGGGVPQGSYQRSCRNARLEGRDLLIAECQRQNGFWRQTRLDIDECRGQDIANDNGHLVCGSRTFGGNYGRYQMPPGSWSQSCRNARIQRDELFAECRARDGDWRRTSIDLDDCRGRAVVNDDGRLRCS